MKEIIGIATDHGGFELKEYLKSSLKDECEIIDLGVFNENSVDYPIIIREACEKLLKKEFSRLIALCGTGIGASIAANRLHGIRAALCHNEFTAEMSRKHNNANVLVLGGRVLEKEIAVKIAKIWLKTSFEGGRHEKRISMLG
ncbi:MAG: ribose 5-phosphate isomerase B [Leptospiraceae bacterium]|nr:ribose 5-phosphate isomerase B [Leptospiraceae bacterium]MCK6382428.1 ribose 5-phosphate isomerase B [Leptospiraceae bacterium]NUM40849.1 ribose 5-phosphate isomerase B [Leptospiraceae bacterium]